MLATTAGSTCIPRIDSRARARHPITRAAHFAGVLLTALGRLRLPQSEHALPLSEHLRRDIGLDPMSEHYLRYPSLSPWP